MIKGFKRDTVKLPVGSFVASCGKEQTINLSAAPNQTIAFPQEVSMDIYRVTKAVELSLGVC